LKRFPWWLRQSVRINNSQEETKRVLSKIGINTVCQSARCPNIFDCFSNKRCTFLILGKSCTRSCGFCAVEKDKTGLEGFDKKEIAKIIEAVQRLGIQHVIITSVTRDDLADGGAGHFADCINTLKGLGEDLSIEVLVPDFQGNKYAIEKVVFSGPDIFSHNMETVPRLYRKARPQADYSRSLEVLGYAKQLDRSIITKSGLMVGLGEFQEEIYQTLKDLRKAKCDIITIGQYLKSAADCLDVEEFLKPEDFVKFTEWARELGFSKYYCGPFVRSSYYNC